MKTLSQLFAEALGESVFGAGAGESVLAVSRFSMTVSEDGNPVVRMDLSYRTGGGEPVEGFVAVELGSGADEEFDELAGASSALRTRREFYSILSGVSVILDAYGISRSELALQAEQGDTEIRQKSEPTVFQHYAARDYLEQDASLQALLDGLSEEKGRVPEALMTEVLRLASCRNLAGKEGVQPAVRYASQAEGEEARSLSAFLERFLGSEVFGDEDVRLRVSDFRPEKLSDGTSTYPGVVFNVSILSGGKTKEYADTAVILGIDRQGDRLFPEADDEAQLPPREIGEYAADILAAWGLNREKVFAQIGFNPVVEVPAHIYRALIALGETGEEPHFESEDDRRLWEAVIEQIEESGCSTEIVFAFYSVHDQDYGDLFCLGFVPLEAPQKPPFEEEPELNPLQKALIEEFMAQKASPEELAAAIEPESEHLPKALVKAAQEQCRRLIQAESARQLRWRSA